MRVRSPLCPTSDARAKSRAPFGAINQILMPHNKPQPCALEEGAFRSDSGDGIGGDTTLAYQKLLYELPAGIGRGGCRREMGQYTQQSICDLGIIGGRVSGGTASSAHVVLTDHERFKL